jgi:methane monooxygenase PmoA-like
MIKEILGVLAAGGCALAASHFVWNDRHDGRIELSEDGRAALIYNYGPQLKAGVPESHRRCCYIFPLLTPAGVSVLDDFPKDHYHHRGVFWAWPVVETEQGKYDLWTDEGVEHRFEKWLNRSADSQQASLVVEDGWYAGDRRIVAEGVSITVFAARDNAREFEVELRLTAVSGPVTLRGSREHGKSYGGFCARLAPRTSTVIRSDSGIVEKDQDLNPHGWAEIESTFEGKRAILRIAADPGNPGAPCQWCLRHYGFVGASFPGRTDTSDGFTLQPGKPARLKFRVQVADRP